MKKLSLYTVIGAVSLLMASCTEDYTDWAEPQTNPQEAAVTIPGFSATGAEAVDLSNAGESVTVFSLAQSTLPENMTLANARIEITPADAAEGTKATTLDATLEGKVDSTLLSETVISYYGKDITERTFNAKVYANAVATTGEAMLIDAGTVQLKVTLSTKLVVPNYYLVGALQGWSADASTGMTCLMYPESTDVLNYTTKWTGDHNLKLWTADAFGNWDACIGSPVNDDESVTGSLVSTGAGSIKAPTGDEYYTFTVNLITNTYKWTKLEDQTPKEYGSMGLIGGFNDWGGDVALTQVTPHNWYAKVTIATDGELKFRANGAWDDSWGVKQNIADAYYGKSNYNGDNLTVPAGTYRVFFNDITGDFAFIAE